MESLTFLQFPLSQLLICRSPNSAKILSLFQSSLHVNLFCSLFSISVSFYYFNAERKLTVHNTFMNRDNGWSKNYYPSDWFYPKEHVAETLK